MWCSLEFRVDMESLIEFLISSGFCWNFRDQFKYFVFEFSYPITFICFWKQTSIPDEACSNWSKRWNLNQLKTLSLWSWKLRYFKPEWFSWVKKRLKKKHTYADELDWWLQRVNGYISCYSFSSVRVAYVLLMILKTERLGYDQANLKI